LALSLEAVAREHAARRMLELSSYLTSARVRMEIRVGQPDEQVAAMASEVGASVVVIGPHSDRSRPSKFLGTTADRIARSCPVPVLVATNPTEHSPRRILVPVDDDGIASQVLAWTRDLAERFDSDISLLHVWSNSVYSYVASMSYATAPNEAQAKQEIEKELTGAATRWLEEIARTGVKRDRVSSEAPWERSYMGHAAQYSSSRMRPMCRASRSVSASTSGQQLRQFADPEDRACRDSASQPIGAS
jgi:nucleotide-binding universal stress UspA family protein